MTTLDADVVKSLSRELFGLGVNSYNRIDVAITNFVKHPEHRLECFAALGDAWSMCDNLSTWRVYLFPLLTTATLEELAAMMTPEERAAWAALPPLLTVYRGCGPNNLAGFSWTLDRAVAERFPLLNRYRVETPLLVTGRVSKARVVLKLDRNEQEIIAPRVRRVSVEPLSGALDGAPAVR